ncbi:MAG: hypothetical protein WBV90_11490, partial [Terrimicrobiaceae bacterium]
LVDGMDAIVVRRLREAQRRLVLQQFVDYAVLGLFAGLAVFAISRVTAASIPGAEIPWWAAVAISLILAAFGAMRRWQSLRSVALELDVRAKTKDRFLTALSLPANETRALLGAARRETSAFASTLSPREHLALRIPAKKALWLLLPVIALGLWEGFRVWKASDLAPELAAAQNLVEQARRAAELEADKDETLQRIAEQLQRSEHQLNVSTEPLREALRTLSDLEQRLSSQSTLDAAEAGALAEALSRNHAELASNLRAGRNAEAAKNLAKLDPAELATALEQAARHLEARRLQELAMQSAAAAKMQLGVMLGSSIADGNEVGRRRFVAALRDIRNGTGVADHDPSRQIEGAEASPGNEKSPSHAADNAPPSGLPGTEKDFGRGEDIARQAEPLNSAATSEDFVEGEIGDGTSLIALFRAAGNDDPQARRAYRNAYQTAAPAALDAVSREQIPAGSRLLVRRYFEAIRPKE